MAMATVGAKPKPHIILLSSPGLGHLIPILELGKSLVRLCNFDVVIYVVETHTSPVETQVLQSAMSPKLCEIIQLPPVNISGLIDPGATVVTQLAVMMREIRPAFRSAVFALKFRPAAIIVDIFGTESLQVAKELGIPKYVYMASNAWFLALTLHVPTLDKEVEGEFVHQKEPLKIPGCRSVRQEDVVDPMLDRTNQQYFEYVRMGVEIVKADATQRVGGYVSFGSGGTLSAEQMMELAWGLELSQQRFIWVVRPPTTKTGDGAFFTQGDGEDDMSGYFPDGFLSRIQKLGQVVPQWSPQVQIMSRPSVGAFLSHCGWNSILESITEGVPIIAWPLYAEQRLNATLLTEELGIAVRPKNIPAKEVVKRGEIERMIRRIMVDEEGREIRTRVRELKESAEKAVSEGGSSYNYMSVLGKELEKSWNGRVQRRTLTL
ncbi:hypothetical protein GH714_012030 [Hevea brasiliensis]|uniref:Glycosyltransferase n=1 Tax=Hevea brasiliensis TaxID=3981 RepID=A0A6A6K453_HEVBR|nr:hypothetical protein GH714_012030 [Hevea brasiliensis]